MHAGTALDGVQAALTEVNGIELPKQSGLPYANITEQYMQSWHDLGFDLHVCPAAAAATTTCLDAPVSLTDAVIAHGPDSIVNIMIQRPAFSARFRPTLSLDDLPPRADASCSGAPPLRPLLRPLLRPPRHPQAFRRARAQLLPAPIGAPPPRAACDSLPHNAPEAISAAARAQQ